MGATFRRASGGESYANSSAHNDEADDQNLRTLGHSLLFDLLNIFVRKVLDISDTGFVLTDQKTRTSKLH